MIEKNAALSDEVESTRKNRVQEVNDLVTRAAAEASVANAALCELESLRVEDKKEARAVIAEKTAEVEEAVAAAREAGERRAEETGE